jgi:hypothetical protein
VCEREKTEKNELVGVLKRGLSRHVYMKSQI